MSLESITIDPRTVLYQENFASGYSLRNVLTQIVRARGTLSLIVTRERLVVTTWFPFSLILSLSDLDHDIPLASLESVEPITFAVLLRGALLTYRDATGEVHRIKVFSLNTRSFLSALDTARTGKETTDAESDKSL